MPIQRLLTVTALFILLSACATFKNTPQQDYVWEIGHICDKRVSFWQMESVRPDGSATVRGATNAPPGWADYQACMREEQARKPYEQWLREHATGESSEKK